jgi:alpha-mannosidase
MSADSRIRRALSTNDHVDRLLRRIRCQISFGRAIDDGRFRDALDQAESLVNRADGTYGSYGELKAAVNDAEKALTPVSKEAKTFTIHCVGHGHIDMNWMWSWPETCATTHDTFASVLSLMEQYPDLTYSQSQASVYELVEKYHPAMFEEIKKRVKEGRWEVAAVHWVEGDKNLASGESLAHHLLYTRQYFQEKFGLSPEDCQLDWEPDTFGHCNTLPGILRQGGVKYYYCCRPGGGQEHLRVGEERPPDGSRVLVNKETTWYNSYVEIGDCFALPAAAFYKKTGLKDWLNVYGIGNHGGGPTREEIDYFIETRDWPCWPNVVFGTAQGWFRKIEPLCADMPVLDHELNFEFTGCYTSQSAIKKANRYGENYCVEAETLNAIADWGSRIADSKGQSAISNPQSAIREAWINVLFNQFHDILPGSGVAATRNHALGLFQETGAITGAIKRNSLLALSRDLNTASLIPDTPEGREELSHLVNTPFEAGSGQGAGESGFSRASGGGTRFRPVMIYNPCAWVRSELVEVNLYDLPKDVDESCIVGLDEDGNAYPTLRLGEASASSHDWGHTRCTLLFYAKDIPAFGYRTFLFGEGDSTVDLGSVEAIDETTFETPLMKVGLSKYGSGLEQLTVKATDVQYANLCEGLGSWEFGTEKPKGMSAWVISDEWRGFSTENPVGYGPSFRVTGPKRNVATDLHSGGSFAMQANQKLLAEGTRSSIQLTTMICGTTQRVDWFAEVDWREIGDKDRGIPGLRVDFECMLDVEDEVPLIYETAFGWIARPPTLYQPFRNEPEFPSLRFVHLQGVGGPSSPGMTLVQDSKYGFSQPRTGPCMRVVRSTYEPDHAPEVAKSTMRYALVFHDAEPTKAELVRLGAAFNHPLIVMPVLLQEGKQATRRGFAEVETESVVVSTMKRAEDGNGLVMRLVNYADVDVEAKVKLDADLVKGFIKATPADLMERPFEGEASFSGTELRVSIPSNSFATVVLT